MSDILDRAKVVYFKGPADSPDKPDKDEIIALFGVVDTAVVGAVDGLVFAETWAALAAITGTRTGQPGRVVETATGTHTDPVTSATVANPGEYRWSGAPVGWRWVSANTNLSAVVTTLQGEVDVLDTLVTGHVGDLANPHEVTKSQIGLGNADDTSDLDKPISTDAQEAFDALDLRVDAVEGIPCLDAYYAFVEVAADYSVIRGITHEGIVDDALTLVTLDHEYQYVELAADGSIITGILWDGTESDDGTSGSTVAAPPIEFAYTTPDRNEVHIVKGGVDITVANVGAGTYLPPVLVGNLLTWATYPLGTPKSLSQEVLAASTALSTVTAIEWHPITGQSPAVGGQDGTTTHATPVRAGRALMFNGGVAVNGDLAGNTPTPPNRLYSWIDACDPLYEGSGPGFAWYLTETGRVAATTAVLVSSHGRGGYAYAGLKKGTVPYANMIAAANRMKFMCLLHGYSFTIPAASWLQGENNVTDLEATYKGYLVEYQADLTTDLNAIRGGAAQMLVITDQIANWTRLTGQPTTSEIPLAQLHAARENPGKIICVGPGYHYDYYSDGVHRTAASYARDGCYRARAQRAGSAWKPLDCESASRTGAVVTLVYRVPVGPLVLDDLYISDPGHYGFEWHQTGGTAQTISTVALSGNIAGTNVLVSVVITLTGNPGSPTSSFVGVAYTGISGAKAGRTTGPRCCLRDSADELDIFGVPMPNWASIDKINL